MFLLYFQSNTLTVLGRQMFVNYSKSQEIKRYADVQINLHLMPADMNNIIQVKGIHIQLKHADIPGPAALQLREWDGDKKERQCFQ